MHLRFCMKTEVSTRAILHATFPHTHNINESLAISYSETPCTECTGLNSHGRRMNTFIYILYRYGLDDRGLESR